jgi:hypothetical protein
MMRRLFFAIVVLSLTLEQRLTAQPTYEQFYTWDGSNLREVYDKPSNVHADHWEIWLYKRDAAHNERNRWGSLEKDTADAVKKELQSSQKFEKRYEAFFHLGWGTETYFNPSAPIAVTKKSNFGGQMTISSTENIYDKLSEFREAFNDAVEMASQEPESEVAEGMKLHSTFGQMLEFANLTKASFEKAQHLYKTLTSLQPSPDSWEQLLHSANDARLAMPPDIRKKVYGDDSSSKGSPERTPNNSGLSEDQMATLQKIKGSWIGTEGFSDEKLTASVNGTQVTIHINGTKMICTATGGWTSHTFQGTRLDSIVLSPSCSGAYSDYRDYRYAELDYNNDNTLTLTMGPNEDDQGIYDFVRAQ